MLTVLGAGMAGLCAAVRARELGVEPVVWEQGDRPGGSMLLSSCVVWRYRAFEEFRAQCPGGDPALQRTVWERLDDGIAWLESLGAPVAQRGTGNPLTTGVRFDRAGLTETLARAAGEVHLGSTGQGRSDAGPGPLILATGGFQGDPALVAEHIGPAAPLRLRANPWSDGDGLRLGLARGAATSVGMGEFYGRNMPDADVPPSQFVGAAQLYARHALVLNEAGAQFLEAPVSWSETEVVQATARQPGAAAWYILGDRALLEEVRARGVRTMVDRAVAVGGTVLPAAELPFPVPREAVLGVRVQPGITHTIGGLRIDPSARVLRLDGTPVDGLYAAGADAGGISAGGYASGLAAALVFGRLAAQTALS